MMWYVHTRANGFRTWVCVSRHTTKTEAENHIPALKAQDDPMWAEAEYLVTDTLKPLSETPRTH